MTPRDHTVASEAGRATSRPVRWARLRRHVPIGGLAQDRLLRTAGPLLLNTASNALLGIAFWVVAARHYGTGALAHSLALVSAMNTLSGICQLNLGPGFAVLVPRAGVHGRRVVLQGYGAATGLTLVVLPAFVFLVLPHLSKLSDVLDSWPRLLLFAGAVATFNIFALQDAALVSLRRGYLVPLENVFFGTAKLLLLLALASAMPVLGVFVSWFLAMLIVIPVVSGAVLARRPPPNNAATVAATGVRGSLPHVLLDYAGYLFLVSSTVFLPVVALELLSQQEAALFAVAWLTTSTLDLLATNIGTALTVETTYGERAEVLRRTILRRALPAVALVSLLAIAAAPLVLRLYGASSAQSAATTLQILLVASVPRALVTFSIAEARANRDIGYVFRLRAQNAVVGLGLAFLLAPMYGAPGMGLAWLSAQLAGAVVAVRRIVRTRPAAVPKP